MIDDGRDIQNKSGEEIPAWSVAEITSYDPATDVYAVGKPSEDGLAAGLVVFTGPASIPNDGYAKGFQSAPMCANYAGDDPAVGDDAGTETDTWTLKKDNSGFVVNGVDTGEGQCRVAPFRPRGMYITSSADRFDNLRGTIITDVRGGFSENTWHGNFGLLLRNLGVSFHDGTAIYAKVGCNVTAPYTFGVSVYVNEKIKGNNPNAWVRVDWENFPLESDGESRAWGVCGVAGRDTSALLVAVDGTYLSQIAPDVYAQRATIMTPADSLTGEWVVDHHTSVISPPSPETGVVRCFPVACIPGDSETPTFLVSHCIGTYSSVSFVQWFAGEWHEWVLPELTGNTQIRPYSADRSGDNILFSFSRHAEGGSFACESWASTDGGASFSLIRDCVEYMPTVAIIGDSWLVLYRVEGDTANELETWVSDDFGVSWERRADVPDNESVVVITDGKNIVVGPETKVSGHFRYVYYSDDRGRSWNFIRAQTAPYLPAAMLWLN